MRILPVPFRHLLLFSVLLLIVPGCGSSRTTDSDEAATAAREASEAASTAPVANPRNLPLDPQQSATLRVYSNPPGCLVFVDLEPVRGEGDVLALTPCEFSVPRGLHSFSVERPGGRRSTQPLEVNDVHELEFDVSASPSELDDPSLLNAPLFEAAVGRSIPLASLNSTERDFDPFVTSDGRTIYFVSDRGGMRGVYMATRRTPYHDFDEPKALLASTGADMPVSPSVTGDGLMLVYSVAEKARLWQLTRADVTSPFDSKEITRGDENSDRAWRSAQLSDDGLRLIWTEEGDDGFVTRAAVRSATGKLFGKTLAFDLPGYHPHLSSDGLRHFSFDGSTLRRARRGTVKQSFGEPELVATLSLENYKVSPRHRQFWVTDDEQWMLYSDNPRGSSDLFIVRLTDGPGWGRIALGKSIADKMALAKKEDDPKPESGATDSVDPRSLPLPYTTHWLKLSKLLSENKSDEAVALSKQSFADPKFAADREQLAWDVELATALAEFHRDVIRGVETLKPGDTVRVSGTRFEFARYDNDSLFLKLKDKEIAKKLSELTPGELVSLADSGPERADAAKALRFGIFLYFQGKSQHSVAEQWFSRTGAEAKQFHERLAARELHQARQELARGNIAAGIGFLDALKAMAPESEAAKLATKDRSSLYEKVEWTPVGPRKWQRGEFGEFTADTTRANGSYLRSDKQYRDFELSCEWKVSGQTALGGVYLRYSGEGKPLDNGAKIHLANDSDLKRMDRFATGALFASDAPSLNASLPEGQWNTLRIRTQGKKVQVRINDKDVLNTTLEESVPASGYVMLDGVAGGLSYRKVLLYELPAAK